MSEFYTFDRNFLIKIYRNNNDVLIVGDDLVKKTKFDQIYTTEYSILIQKNKILTYVGERIYNFIINDKIINFINNFERNDLNPIIIGEKYIFFIDEKIYIEKNKVDYHSKNLHNLPYSTKEAFYRFNDLRRSITI